MLSVIFTLLSMTVYQANQVDQMQVRKVVHLRPQRNVIETGFGGKRLELVNAPPILHLPAYPPKADDRGNPWNVEVDNLGPGPVTIIDGGRFAVQIGSRQTVRIFSNGRQYSMKTTP